MTENRDRELSTLPTFHPSDARAVTFRYEKWRALSTGVFETAIVTFLLLIAVRHFHAGSTAKALVAAGGSAGLLITPLIVAAVSSLQCRAASAAAALAAFGGLTMLAAALFPVLPVFVLASVIGPACASSSVPLLTQIYRDNYPKEERGRLFARTVVIRIVVAAVFSELAGRALSGNMEWFRGLLIVFGTALFFSSYCLWQYPSRPLVYGGGSNWFRGLRFVREDKVFRLTLIAWMLMGFGNLMMLPLRVEYLANEKYGIAMSAATIAFLTGVLPNIARLVMSPVWGHLFDRINFFLLRIILNIGFALGILGFFLGQNMTGFVIGALMFGVAQAGGEVAWSLWVTKLAPADHVAEYMAVHTFLTGVRGVLAPFVAFYLVRFVSIHLMGVIAVAFIVSASLMLLPETRWGRRRRPATPLVEEVSE